MRQPRSRVVTMAATVAVLGLVLTARTPTLAQDATPEVVFDPPTRIPAHIHAGPCDDLGDVAFPLAEAGYGLPVPIGPGATPTAVTTAAAATEGANPAAVSVTTVAASLDQILGAEHAVTAHRAGEGDEAETLIACGDIGGFRAGDDLVFGLRERNGSGYGGTAWLHDNRDGTTTVSLFLASGLAADSAAEPAG